MKQHLPKILVALAVIGGGLITMMLYSGEAETGWFGYVEGEYILVGLPAGGILETLNVRRGDQVESGAALFGLEAIEEAAAVREAEASVTQQLAIRNNLLKGLRNSEIDTILAQKEQASAEMELARLTLKRREELLLTNNTSEQAVDEARAAYERAKGQVEELEARLVTAKLPAREDEIAQANAGVERARAILEKYQYKLVKRVGIAPEDALVFETFYRVGEFVPASKAVVSLLPEGNVKIRFFIPEAELANISYGQAIIVLCDGCGEGVAAKVTYISPDAEFTPPVIYSEKARQKLVFMIEAHPNIPENFPLKPGQPVEIKK